MVLNVSVLVPEGVAIGSSFRTRIPVCSRCWTSYWWWPRRWCRPGEPREARVLVDPAAPEGWKYPSAACGSLETVSRARWRWRIERVRVEGETVYLSRGDRCLRVDTVSRKCETVASSYDEGRATV